MPQNVRGLSGQAAGVSGCQSPVRRTTFGFRGRPFRDQPAGRVPARIPAPRPIEPPDRRKNHSDVLPPLPGSPRETNTAEMTPRFQKKLQCFNRSWHGEGELGGSQSKSRRKATPSLHMVVVVVRIPQGRTSNMVTTTSIRPKLPKEAASIS